MRNIFLLILLFPLTLAASKILSYNIYERTDRADVMITFDTPFEGKITQNSIENKITIKLDGASIESPKIKKVNSEFLHSLTITPIKGETQLIAAVGERVNFVASKTSDGYGLRLRFLKQQANTQQSDTQNTSQIASNNPLSALPTKKDTGVSQRYYIVVGFLVLAILVLLYFKRKIQNSQETQKQGNWLFKSPTTQTQESAKNSQPKSEVSLRFQKAINEQTSVVMLDFGPQSYLVLMGANNILLDKFHDNIPTTQQEFETILQSRHEQLEEFLGEGEKSFRTNENEPLQAYKERAASLYSREL